MINFPDLIVVLILLLFLLYEYSFKLYHKMQLQEYHPLYETYRDLI